MVSCEAVEEDGRLITGLRTDLVYTAVRSVMFKQDFTRHTSAGNHVFLSLSHPVYKQSSSLKVNLDVCKNPLEYKSVITSFFSSPMAWAFLLSLFSLMIHSFNRFTHYSLFFRFESLVIPWGPPLTRTPLYLCSEVTPGKTPRLLVEAQVTLLQQRRTHRSELLLQRCWNKAETTGGERNSLQGLTAFVVSADRERAAKV